MKIETAVNVALTGRSDELAPASGSNIPPSPRPADPGDPMGPEPRPRNHASAIYLAIAINWCVDALGLSFLFHTYLVGWDVAVPVLMGTLLSTGFAIFAVHLVHRPMRIRPFPALSWPAIASLVALVLACIGTILASFVFVGDTSKLFDLGVLAAWTMLGLGALVVIALTYGVMDTVYVLARGFVMVLVGFLVAGPLHEAMFAGEIEKSFRDAQVNAIDMEIADLDKKVGTDDEQQVKACLARTEFPSETDCKTLEAPSRDAELLVEALDIARRTELEGSRFESEKPGLRERARGRVVEQEVSQVLKMVPSRLRGMGATYSGLVDRQKRAQERAGAFKRCNDVRMKCAPPAERTDERAKQVAKDRERLQGERDDLIQGKREMGSLERTQEFGRLTRGVHGGDEMSALIAAKLRHAWILTLIMPFIVMTMKLTLGGSISFTSNSRRRAR